MHTDDLVSKLAARATPLDPRYAAKRFGRALLAGLSASSILLVALFGVRSDMPQLIATPQFWLKLAFPLAVVAASVQLATRLARPGARTTLAWITAAAPLAVMWTVAALIAWATPASLRLDLMLGPASRVGTLNIVLLSVPGFIASIWAMRGLAPTRLVLAGAGAGLLAGAQSVLVYTLYVLDIATPFWSVWYVMGMAMPTLAGALLGPVLLRW
jgi:hypothetical protein